MASENQLGAGLTPDRSGVVLSDTDAERAAWPLFSPYAATKRALWIEAGQPRFYRRGASFDDPNAFKLLDRCGGRIFAPETVRNRHPFIITDSITGRPVWTFGAGGSAPNALDTNFNGTLSCPSILDTNGAETNNLPLFAPDTGYTLAFKARVPAANATVNGVTFTATGGTILGGGRTDAAAGGFTAQIDSGSSGYLRVYNQAGVETTGQFASRDVNLKDGAWHTYIVTYDDAAGTFRVWVDGVLVNTTTGCTTDLNPANGGDKPVLGALGLLASGPAGRFFGFLSCVFYLPTPAAGNTDASRAALLNLMAAR